MNTWYEEDIDLTPADCGWIHEDEIPDLDAAKSSLEAILRDVYVTGSPEDLEANLMQICALFDLEVPSGKPFLKQPRSAFAEYLFNTSVEMAKSQYAQ